MKLLLKEEKNKCLKDLKWKIKNYKWNVFN
jgi:hypothetical protein